MFKTELHCHSNDVSCCARIDAETIIDKYTSGGYSTVVLSNHLSIYTWDFLGCTSWNEFVDKFVAGYKNLKEKASGKLEILLGMELRFKNSNNDYLVFGVTEEFLREHENILELDPPAFHTVAKENGLLFIQAHPFRDWMTVTPPSCVDGVEVYNGHKGHDSRNEIAEAWADKYGLIKTSGTDLHYKDVPTNAGILTDEKITSMAQLIEVLKNGKYSLIKE
jgi:predicted metal-dependent phosphoesterase TrpH